MIREERHPNAEQQAQVIVSEATQHANRLIEWAKQRNAELLKNAERDAETLRNEATHKDFAAKARIGLRVDTFIESLLWGLLLTLFLMYVGSAFRLKPLNLPGFYSAVAVVIGVALCASVSDSFGILSLFEPFLIAGAIFVSVGRDLDIGEIVLNSGYIVFQRLAIVVTLALAGVLLALTTAGVLAAFVYLTLKIVSISMQSTESFSSPLLMVGDNAFIFSLQAGSILLSFCQSFSSALCGAAFLSVLAGPQRKPDLKSVADEPILMPRPRYPDVRLRSSPIVRFLLIYWPTEGRALVAHILYYLSIASIGAGVVFFNGDSWQEEIVSTLAILFLCSIAYCFRYWALVELAWVSKSSTVANRSKDSISRLPASGRELLARIFTVITASQAVVSLCLVILVINDPEDVLSLADSLPFIAISVLVTAYVTIFCYRWAKTERTLARLGATAEITHLVLRRSFFSLGSTGATARWATGTFYAYLGLTGLFLVHPGLFIGDLDTTSAAGLIQIVTSVLLHLALPLFASHEWASAEAQRAVLTDLSAGTSSKEGSPQQP